MTTTPEDMARLMDEDTSTGPKVKFGTVWKGEYTLTRALEGNKIVEKETEFGEHQEPLFEWMEINGNSFPVNEPDEVRIAVTELLKAGLPIATVKEIMTEIGWAQYLDSGEDPYQYIMNIKAELPPT